jgi:hypothetical protein
MKRILLAVLTLILITGCHKETQNACDSKNPMEDVGWLKDMQKSMTNCACETSIIQGTYLNQTVFFIANTDPLCDGINLPTLFDCNGKAIKSFTESDYQDFYDKVTRDKVLYRCKTEK